MARHRFGNSTQRLYFASIYLELLDSMGKDDDLLNKQAVIKAHRQSCIFQLVMGYQALLWEVATAYDIEVGSAPTLTEVTSAASQMGRPIGDLARMERLEQDSNSWLAGLLSFWSEVLNPEPPQSSLAADAGKKSEINFSTNDGFDQTLQLHDCYEKLKLLVEDMRGVLEEW